MNTIANRFFGFIRPNNPISRKTGPKNDSTTRAAELAITQSCPSFSKEITKLKTAPHEKAPTPSKTENFFHRIYRRFTSKPASSVESTKKKEYRHICNKRFKIEIKEEDPSEKGKNARKTFSLAYDNKGRAYACLDAPISETKEVDDPLIIETYIYKQLKNLKFQRSLPIIAQEIYFDELGRQRIRLIFELCTPLQEAINSNSLTKTDQNRIFVQAGLAMCDFHDVGLIHRDLKWANILIDSKNNLFLTDFDTSGKQGFLGEGNELKIFQGSIAFAAPETLEQMKNNPHNVLDTQTHNYDIYSYGLISLELYGQINLEKELLLAELEVSLKSDIEKQADQDPNVNKEQKLQADLEKYRSLSVEELQIALEGFEKLDTAQKIEAVEIMQQKAKSVLNGLPNTPEFALIKKMLEVDPAKRPARQELREELTLIQEYRSWLAKHPIHAVTFKEFKDYKLQIKENPKGEYSRIPLEDYRKFKSWREQHPNGRIKEFHEDMQAKLLHAPFDPSENHRRFWLESDGRSYSNPNF